MNKYFKGFSAYLSIGRNKGIYFIKDGPSIRINLLWISICIGFFDLERMIQTLLDGIDKQEICASDIIDNMRKDIKKKEETIGSLRELYGKQKYEIEQARQIEVLINKLKEKEKTLEEKIEELVDKNDDLQDEITDLGDVNEENNNLKESIENSEKQTKEHVKKIEELKKYIEDLIFSVNSSSSSSSQ